MARSQGFERGLAAVALGWALGASAPAWGACGDPGAPVAVAALRLEVPERVEDKLAGIRAAEREIDEGLALGDQLREAEVPGDEVPGVPIPEAFNARLPGAAGRYVELRLALLLSDPRIEGVDPARALQRARAVKGPAGKRVAGEIAARFSYPKPCEGQIPPPGPEEGLLGGEGRRALREARRSARGEARAYFQLQEAILDRDAARTASAMKRLAVTPAPTHEAGAGTLEAGARTLVELGRCARAWPTLGVQALSVAFEGGRASVPDAEVCVARAVADLPATQATVEGAVTVLVVPLPVTVR